jgi:acyl-CoA thioesterase-1
MRKRKIIVALAVCIAAASAPATAAPREIVALGDSLVAGYGLQPGEAFPEQLEAALRRRGWDVAVANAGVSGDTAADGFARFEWSVPASADLVIVELGANDFLRGLDPAVTRDALGGILAKLQARNQRVLLAGMLAPRNLGPEYVAAFDKIFPELAAQHGVALYPFFLEGVAQQSSLNQPDGLHPNAKGVARIVENILPYVEALLRQAGGG